MFVICKYSENALNNVKNENFDYRIIYEKDIISDIINVAIVNDYYEEPNALIGHVGFCAMLST